MKNEQLHNIKSSGFKIPDNYFESLEDAVFSRLSEDHLDSKVSSSGFEVPDDYFETFDSKVLNAIPKNESAKVISIFSWRNVSYISGIAASLVLAFNIFFNNSNQLSIDNLETASIESYLMDEDLSAYDIAPYLNLSEFESDNFVENTMTASDIEDYLIQNSDVEQLIID
ncbi:MAG: hypothetical protein ACSHXF_12880 [Aquaticitalea sp.]